VLAPFSWKRIATVLAPFSRVFLNTSYLNLTTTYQLAVFAAAPCPALPPGSALPSRPHNLPSFCKVQDVYVVVGHRAVCCRVYVVVGHRAVLFVAGFGNLPV